VTGTELIAGLATSALWSKALTYRGDERRRISMPVGGIGTGTVGFGGRGQWRDWEVESRPSKGLVSELSFLACHVRSAGTGAQARVLEGDLFEEEAEGAQGSGSPLAGLPRFADCTFQSVYPFGRVLLADRGFPVEATVEVFNPLCPGDEDLSGLPIAVVAVRLKSVVDEVLSCSVMFSAEALVGHSGRKQGAESRPVAVHVSDGGNHGYLLSDEALGLEEEDRGTLAVGVTGEAGWAGPTWGFGKWNQGLLEMWRAFQETGRPGEGTFGVGRDVPAATYGSSVAGTVGGERVLEARGSAEVAFVLAWHFPNRRSWIWGSRGPGGMAGRHNVGNYYARGFGDAWDVIRAQVPRLKDLEETTSRFAQAFWSSDLSPRVKEAALFNLSTLRSQTLFRTADGNPFGWEGCLDAAGCCLGSCTHVWNYDLATPFLFGSLARKMRELEYRHATPRDGGMSFRIMLPLEEASQYEHVAADGQFGCVVKLFREWRHSGDDAWLDRLWPACKRSMEFAWGEGSWDSDRDGVAEGAQHNTMDVEYFGPNPVIQSWYLAALAASAEMARAVGDTAFSELCRNMFLAGAASTEELLFNGSYYQQKVVPPGDFSTVAPRLRRSDMGAEDPHTPEFQIGDGCIIDQLVGDTYARVAGLPAVFDRVHASTALQSIHQLNYVGDFGDWTNYMRTYAGRGERGHIVLSFPKGLPGHPMPYWSEVWTGLEYVYAVGLVQAGERDLAEEVVAAVRERHSGNRRNPFDETECGHHYARALSSWGLVVAFTGFSYDARSATMEFARASNVRWFWSNGRAWGTFEQRTGNHGGRMLQLNVLYGDIEVDRVLVGGDTFRPGTPGRLLVGEYALCEGAQSSGEVG
jgi:non-lysosomal glucosylceramidase